MLVNGIWSVFVLLRRLKMSCKRWYRSRKNQVVLLIMIFIIGVLYYFLVEHNIRVSDLDLARRDVESRLKDALKEDKGSGCTIPKLDPFAKEVMQLEKDHDPIVCEGTDWVRCYMQYCKVIENITSSVKNIKCEYRDIIYVNDYKYVYSQGKTVLNELSYELVDSDHVEVTCSGIYKTTGRHAEWFGYAIGVRDVKETVVNNNDTMNVLMLGFDSTSHSGFIRRMPKSYKVLTQVLNATVLNGYNIVGDGTPAAIFPIFTGKTELELPDARKKVQVKKYIDDMPFIFFDAKKHGYRTAYFEDMPNVGTFQYRFNGFTKQPTDHYMRTYLLSMKDNHKLKLLNRKHDRYCNGDRPNYHVMLDVTKQVMNTKGKKFIFNFIADICHDDFSMISIADDYFSKYLLELLHGGYLENTLLVVMGDHGSRYSKVRNTLQGKQEERLPLMALRLPTKVVESHPKYLENLKTNANILTTPFDLHSTFLYSIGIPQYRSSYAVPGSEILRSLSLFHEIPANRSCSEAAIEPHWCACLHWRKVDPHEHIYNKAVNAFVTYLNDLTHDVRDKCALRTLTSIEWVMRQVINEQLLKFKKSKDVDGYLGSFVDNTKIIKEFYEVKITVGPGNGIYEASIAYNILENKFIINTTDISRINAYGTEPHCVSQTRPDLNMYCYCKD